MMEKKFNNPRKDDYRDEVIDIRRVTKVTKGGRTLHFSATVAVGDGKMSDGKTLEIVVKPGDRVVCSKYSGSQIKYNECEYLILSQNDILAIVE